MPGCRNHSIQCYMLIHTHAHTHTCSHQHAHDTTTMHSSPPTQDMLALQVHTVCSASQALVLRLQVLHAKLLADTYADDVLVALQTARDELTMLLTNVEEKLRKVRGDG